MASAVNLVAMQRETGLTLWNDREIISFDKGDTEGMFRSLNPASADETRARVQIDVALVQKPEPGFG